MTETEERIDYERLKKQENIAFYEEVILFEDELADNGEAILSVKIVSCYSSIQPHPLPLLLPCTASYAEWFLHSPEVFSSS